MEPAIGRPTGQLATDHNGLARYTFNIEVPSGRGNGNEPDLSLCYTQGASNGILGQGWNLAGLSTVRLAEASLPFDLKTIPSDYDRAQPRYSLDGLELLAINGKYGAADTRYTTEVNEYERRISHYGTGFLVSGQAGGKVEYGTTPDSCVLSSDRSIVREWRIKKQTDIHGNYVTYNYSQQPVQSGSSSSSLKDLNTSYILSISYTSNEKTGYQGLRQILFDYTAREDPVVQTVFGDKVVIASRLSAIRIAVATTPSPTVLRSYAFEYTSSPVTGSSCLSQIFERAHYGSQKTLIPTKFTYTTTPANKPLFEFDRSRMVTYDQSNNNISLMPLDVSGRALSDMACLCYHNNSEQLSIRTFLAERSNEPSLGTATVTWNPSSGKGAIARLPPFSIQEDRPSILSADLNGDGRADMVIPFRSSEGSLHFSLSLANGTGFTDYFVKSTDFQWFRGSTFMSGDVNGDGKTDVIEVCSIEEKLAFRIFESGGEGGEVVLGNPRHVLTEDVFAPAIKWLQVQTQRSGGFNLVRIYAKESQSEFGGTDVRATTYSLDASPTGGDITRKGKDSLLGTYAHEDVRNLSILAADINGDGVQDLVITLVRQKLQAIEFSFTTYLNNGQGLFGKHGDPFITSVPVITDDLPEKAGTFHLTRFNSSDFPALTYVYREQTSRDYIALLFHGTCSGFVRAPQRYMLARGLDLGSDQDWTITSVDLTGSGLTDWLFYTMKSDYFTLCPIYNRGLLTDHLLTVTDPMGMLSQIEYRSLADPLVYDSEIAWDNYAISSPKADYTLIAAPSHVVSKIKTINDPKVNAIKYLTEVEKKYRKAAINLSGRGWQGFGSVVSYNATTNTTTTETYLQRWPLSGKACRITYASGPPETTQVLQSESIEYEARALKMGPWTTYRVQKLSSKLDRFEGSRIARSSGSEFTYDNYGNLALDASWGSSGRRLYTRFAYQMVNDVLPLMIRKKESSKLENTNLEMFEDGDLTLMHADYNSNTGVLKSTSHWSSETGFFAKQSVEFDAYGNEVLSVSPSGLEIRTIYEDFHHCLPVKRTETGIGVNLSRTAAYDALTGTIAILEEENGSTKFTTADAFGRGVASRKLASAQHQESTMSGKSFFNNTRLLGDPDFLQRALSKTTVPDRLLECGIKTSASKQQYMFIKTLVRYKSSDDGQTETVEYLDCAGRTRKISTQNGGFETVWKYTEDDSRQLRLCESFPTTQSAIGAVGDMLDWIPDPKKCMVMTYDSLRRLVSQKKPGHQEDGSSIEVRFTYLEGGARVQSTVSQKPVSGQMITLSDTVNEFEIIGEEDKIVTQIDEGGRRTRFAYDLLGHLTSITDAAGNSEVREHSSGGKITRTSDKYRNTVFRKYGILNELVEEKNAMGQTIKYIRDAKGRVVEQRGDDGRTISYKHDQSGKDLVMLTQTKDMSGKIESQYDYVYDERGRVSQKILTCPPEAPLQLSFSYDWQDQITETSYPDSSSMVRAYTGALLSSTSMKADGTRITAQYQRFNGNQKPERWTINGGGLAPQTTTNEIKYDSLGFPVSHSMTGSALLVQNNYLFNGLDQLSRVHDFQSGETTDYKYEARRLISYQEGSMTALNYEYDLSGNVKTSKDVHFEINATSLQGTRADQGYLNVKYDQCGRMVQRSTMTEKFGFGYDSFGQMCSITNNTLSGAVTEILSDFEGLTLMKKLPDGSRELCVGSDYILLTRSDGSRRIQRKWHGSDRLLATVRTELPAPSKEDAAKATQSSANIYYTDTKNNITHIYDGNGNSIRRLRYDPFGVLLEAPPEDETNATYEANPIDGPTGMYDFGARWYDPLACRFAVPDDILDEKLLKRNDGINRYAFENNDPINYVDPTGHWSENTIMGLCAGIALVVASVVISVATAGLASPLAIAAAGALTGALMGAGINAITYSMDHKNEENADKFFYGYFATVGIGAATGAITGALSSGMGVASATRAAAQAGTRAASTAATTTGSSVLKYAASVGVRGLLSASSAMANKMVSNAIERDIFGRDVDIMDGVVTAGLFGFAAGVIKSGGQDSWNKKLSGPLDELKKRVGSKIVGGFMAGVGAAAFSVLFSPLNPRMDDDYDYTKKSDGFLRALTVD